MKKELGLLVLLIVLCLTVVGVEIGQQLSEGASMSQLQLPRFLTTANLTNLATSIGLYGVFSIGLGMVIITGGIDLSVGSMFALCGVLLSIALMEWKWAWPLAAVFVTAFPMALGWAHGTLVTRARIQPFIVTLCGLLIYRGLARYIAYENTKGLRASVPKNRSGDRQGTFSRGAHAVCYPHRYGYRHVVCVAPFNLWPLSAGGRAQ
jgi:ribose transport system permease protein